MKNLNYVNPNKEFWKGKNVLVTGHTGFKGSWLSIWLLEMGCKVSGISLNPDSKNNLFESLNIQSEIRHIICDIRDESQILNHFIEIKPDIIFHLAAQPLVVTSYKKPLETWQVNVIGTLNILNAMTKMKKESLGVFITTDKVYKNKEWDFGYRETDELGGHDPYSSSKAATEIAIASWRSSFCKNNINGMLIASARAGNVIGGGDWAENRIIPDVIKSIFNNEEIIIRNPFSTRPWQHVLEPLGGYLKLAEKLSFHNKKSLSSFNFGPLIESNKSVKDLVEESLKYWEGKYKFIENSDNLHEAGRLNLSIDKSLNNLNWHPKWNFSETVQRTINWYKFVLNKEKTARDATLADLNEYLKK